MARKTLFMETTGISATKTAAEITEELVDAGAVSVNGDYKDGKVVGLRWVMRVDNKDLMFDMPVRVEPIFNILSAKRMRRSAAFIHEQAERVAWRQLLRWVQAQNALLDTKMVQPQEVYLPYMVHAQTGQTFFEMMQGNQFRMLGTGKEW